MDFPYSHQVIPCDYSKNSHDTETNSQKPTCSKSSLSFAHLWTEEQSGPVHLSQAHLNLSWVWLFPPSSAGTLCSCLRCTFLSNHAGLLYFTQNGPGICMCGGNSLSQGEISLALGFWGSCCGRWEQYLAAEPGAELRKNKGVVALEVECDNPKGIFHQLQKIRYLFSKLKLRPESNPGILIHIQCS